MPLLPPKCKCSKCGYTERAGVADGLAVLSDPRYQKKCRKCQGVMWVTTDVAKWQAKAEEERKQRGIEIAEPEPEAAPEPAAEAEPEAEPEPEPEPGPEPEKRSEEEAPEPEAEPCAEPAAEPEPAAESGGAAAVSEGVPPGSAPAAAPAADEAKVARLMELGYAKENCEAALVGAGGDIKAATEVLLQSS